MNKIKAKINAEDQFSPWEQSFLDLNQTIQHSRKQIVLPQLNTLPCKPCSNKKDPPPQVIRSMNRTSLNISKINLHAPNQEQPEPISNRESRRYLGPRVSFYSKMNPRITNISRQQLETEGDLTHFSSVKKQLSRLVRDNSIKYLEIIDQNQASERKHGVGHEYILPRMSNMRRLSVVKARKSEQHQYIRRLKLIYNSRRH